MAEGRFITLEGGEGSGKSTQARLLETALRAAGLPTLLTREPGGSPGAEEIRRLLVDGTVGRWDAETETLLHYAARRDHLTKAIKPALAAGRWVICDRFADSTLAYQGYGHGVDRRLIETLQAAILGGRSPDLTIILDLPAEEGLRRARGRGGGGDRYERMDIGFHRRLREGYLAIGRAEPQRCVVVDAARDLDAVQAELRGLVRSRLGVALA